jgi:hypothetical protein
LKKPYVLFLTSLTVSLVIFLALLEISSYGALAILSHNDKFKAWNSQVTLDSYKNLNWHDPSQRYHPYLGYARVTDIPENENRDTFRVAILGGSFAQHVGNYLESPQGKRFIADLLTKNSISKTAKVEIINLANAGYKQPQILLSSLLYIEKADLFLSIEGFNEIAVHHQTCLPIEWPINFALYDATAETNSKKYFESTKAAYNFLYEMKNHTVFGKLAFYLLGDRLIDLSLDFQRKHITEIEMSQACKDHKILNQSESAQAAQKIWLDNVKKQHKIHSALQKPIKTFLQPNQYLPGTKPWSKEESQMFTNSNFTLPEIVKTLYAPAAESFKALSKSNPNLYDLTTIYSKTDETIYVDACCHVNELGQRLVAEALSPYIINELKTFERKISKQSAN